MDFDPAKNFNRRLFGLIELAREHAYLPLGAQGDPDPGLLLGLVGEVERFGDQLVRPLQMPSHGVDHRDVGEHAAGARLVTSFAADTDELLETVYRGVEVVEVPRPESRHRAHVPCGRLALEAHAPLDRLMVRTTA
jgi:hypothetical protein